ncbi:MAG: hypothetical protein ACE144_06335 [Thermodesulfobacteriota bacterium]
MNRVIRHGGQTGPPGRADPTHMGQVIRTMTTSCDPACHRDVLGNRRSRCLDSAKNPPEDRDTHPCCGGAQALEDILKKKRFAKETCNPFAANCRNTQSHSKSPRPTSSRRT